MSIFGTRIEEQTEKTVERSTRYIVWTLLWLAALGMVVCCGEKRPEDVLSRAEMVQLLEEIYIAEERLNHMALSRDSSRKVAEALTQRIFENAAITDTSFQRSFDYYMEHPKEMELIYTALVDSLQLEEQRVPFSLPDHQ